MKYLWTEDTGAGLHFWQLVNHVLFDDEFVVESKGSNQGILEAVFNIDMKDNDLYYIAFDNVADNQDVRNKYRLLKRAASRSLLWESVGIRIVVSQNILTVLDVENRRKETEIERLGHYYNL